MPLNNSNIRSDAQLKEDGFSASDIKQFRKAECQYYLLQIECEEAEGRKDYDTVLDLEPRIQELEFLLKYQGKNPKDIPLAELKEQIAQKSDDHVIDQAFKRIKNQGTGIRAFCLTCMNGQSVEVRMCEATHCPLWPFRLGGNPLFGKTLKPVEDITFEGDEIVVVEDDPDEGKNDGD